MYSPDVTIIVVPRERFQFAQESLESLYQNTHHPFSLIYVDNNSPVDLQDYLKTAAKEKGFQLLRSDRFLSPNQARNLGLNQANQQTPSKYIVFVDNDVIFAPGWLTALVNCAEETAATVVGSLVCQYRPVHTIVHCAGGEYMPTEDLAKFIQGVPSVPQTADIKGKWQVSEKTYFQNRSVAEVQDQLKRQPTGFVEFHSMLVRQDIFEQIGLLDEGFSCTKEYLDFCMLIARAGGTIYLEPASVVTFLTHPPAPSLKWSDLPYFMVRWSDAWERQSLLHFQKKWDLVENTYFVKRLQKLGRRRREEVIQPIVNQFNFLSTASRKWLEKRLVVLEKRLNHYVSERHKRGLAD
ncbi:MAG: glycosyltransferase [Drouetiella hepatica Uher 2000/2452]|jgi:GT2 family glycosyltransferase|uniref:Glycosyltransferase n=1 Tax=Drouetiella hepatica Uher 2000/2452 TaxID=904376 RepID=A0A951QHA5_9CYAN|nr:glycosyltransferase [Drouetiella hepatica Uher 2000/2452]